LESLGQSVRRKKDKIFGQSIEFCIMTYHTTFPLSTAFLNKCNPSTAVSWIGPAWLYHIPEIKNLLVSASFWNSWI